VSPQHLLVILSKKFHVLVDSKKFHVLVSFDFGYLDFGPRRYNGISSGGSSLSVRQHCKNVPKMCGLSSPGPEPAQVKRVALT